MTNATPNRTPPYSAPFTTWRPKGMLPRIAGRGAFASPRGGQHLRQFGAIEDNLMGQSLGTPTRSPPTLRRQVQHRSRQSVASAQRRRPYRHLRPTDIQRRALLPHRRLPRRRAAGAELEDVFDLAEQGATSDVTIGLIDTRLPSPITETEQSITAAAADDARRGPQFLPGAPLLRSGQIYVATDN